MINTVNLREMTLRTANQQYLRGGFQQDQGQTLIDHATMHCLTSEDLPVPRAPHNRALGRNSRTNRFALDKNYRADHQYL